MSAPTAIGPISVSVGLPGGVSAAINVNAAAVIKASAGILCRIVVVAAGSAGSFVINDLASTSGSAATNTIWTAAYNATNVYAGAVIELLWPCATGIAVTTLTTSGLLNIAFA